MGVESYDEFDDSEHELMEMASLLLIMSRRRKKEVKLRESFVEALDSGSDKSFYWEKSIVNIIVSYKNYVKVIVNISSGKTYYNKLLGNEW